MQARDKVESSAPIFISVQTTQPASPLRLSLACSWLPAMHTRSLRSAEHVHKVISVPACPADQLQRATERQEYAEAAHLLEAVQQLAGHFQSYVQIPKVGPGHLQLLSLCPRCGWNSAQGCPVSIGLVVVVP